MGATDILLIVLGVAMFGGFLVMCWYFQSDKWAERRRKKAIRDLRDAELAMNYYSLSESASKQLDVLASDYGVTLTAEQKERIVRSQNPQEEFLKCIPRDTSLEDFKRILLDKVSAFVNEYFDLSEADPAIPRRDIALDHIRVVVAQIDDNLMTLLVSSQQETYRRRVLPGAVNYDLLCCLIVSETAEHYGSSQLDNYLTAYMNRKGYPAFSSGFDQGGNNAEN